MQLDKDKIRHLKSLAHSRKPIVSIGLKGLSENILKESRVALKHHELVKMKVTAQDRDQRDQIIDTICEETGATCIQKVGGKAVFFLRNTQKPVIVFP